MNLKRLFKNLLVISAMVCILLPNTYVSASTYVDPVITEDMTYQLTDTISWTISPEGVVTFSGTGDIPSQDHFYYQGFIKKIIIEDGITSIGDKCFKNLESLTTVVISNDVETIGNNAFIDCKQLTNVQLSSSLKKIGDGTFSGCENLIALNCPSSLEEIGKSAFAKCTSLTTLNLNDGLEIIGDSAFNSCLGLTEVTIPNTVTTIGNYAFGDGGIEQTGTITKFTVPKSVTSIGEYSMGTHCVEGFFYALDGATIYGYKGSEAEDYVNRTNQNLQGDKKISFVALDDTITEDSTPNTSDNFIFKILFIGTLCGVVTIVSKKIH